MKIVEQNTKTGEITVLVENINDLWTLYNIILKDDIVSALTQRRVVMQEGSSGERKVMRLTLKVEDVAFHEFSTRLRVKGTIIEGPDEYVSYGSYHTFNVEIHQEITIKKDNWLRQDLKRLKESSQLSSNFLIFFIAMETGLANLALVTNYSTNKIATIKRNIPGKRYEQGLRNKALKDFFDSVLGVLEENLKNHDINLIVICGPGNTNKLFLKYVKENASDDYVSKIKICHATSGTESAIYETLKSSELTKFKNNIKLVKEAEKIEDIMEQFAKDPDLIAIGFEEVPQAAQMGAVEELLVADTLIRGASKDTRLKIEEIINNVENTGGNVMILSSDHPAGERLVDLGSLVGILRFKF
ncbi:MAG: mRNA surveillance protein pelota [Candidatus Lokiarchaeota archaeon]